MVEINLIMIIAMYSARKINANHPPIYSTLNPDTNSDSPSAKSKGLRFVSARLDIIHSVNRSIFPVKKYNIVCDFIISLKEYDILIRAIVNIIKKKDTS